MEDKMTMMQMSQKYYSDFRFRMAVESVLDQQELKKFEVCMATARLFWDVQFHNTLRQTMGQVVYKYLKDKSEGLYEK